MEMLTYHFQNYSYILTVLLWFSTTCLTLRIDFHSYNNIIRLRKIWRRYGEWNFKTWINILTKCLEIGLWIQNPVYCKTYDCLYFYRIPQSAVYCKPHDCFYIYRIPQSAASFISWQTRNSCSLVTGPRIQDGSW